MEKKDGLPVYIEDDFITAYGADDLKAGDVFYYVARELTTCKMHIIKLVKTKENVHVRTVR